MSPSPIAGLLDLQPLRLPVQPKKMGFVATSAALRRALRTLSRQIGVATRPWMRNLGHELFGARPLRRQERTSGHTQKFQRTALCET